MTVKTILWDFDGVILSSHEIRELGFKVALEKYPQEQIEALERVAGSDVVKLIKHQSDPVIEKIVSGWARDFETKRSIDLGFKAENNFDEIIKIYIEDDLAK